LLLSPRTRFTTNGEYICVVHRYLKNDKLGKNTPKFAISNNFALPSPLQDLLTEVRIPLLFPVRPYAIVLSYRGGAHKAISGSFSFSVSQWTEILVP
jgi:hypothetical protein